MLRFTREANELIDDRDDEPAGDLDPVGPLDHVRRGGVKEHDGDQHETPRACVASQCPRALSLQIDHRRHAALDINTNTPVA